MNSLEWALQFVLLKVQEIVSETHFPHTTLLTYPHQIYHKRKTDKCGVVLVGTEGVVSFV